MSGVQLPGILCAFLDAIEIDAGTMCRSGSPAPGAHGVAAHQVVGTKKRDISPADAALIVKEAATWEGTPYSLVGEASAKSNGGDCSGSTYKIYKAANCPYKYQTSHGFPAYARKSGLFRELRSKEAKQDGDI